jgi:hypothetical protein
LEATERGGRLDCTTTGLTVGRGNILRATNTASTIQFSAEL